MSHRDTLSHTQLECVAKGISEKARKEPKNHRNNQIHPESTMPLHSSQCFCSIKYDQYSLQNQARRKLYAKANDDRLRSQCFKSAWVNAVLHGGFNVSKEHNTFRSAYNIAGQEVCYFLVRVGNERI